MEASFLFYLQIRLLYCICKFGTSLKLSHLFSSNLNLLLGCRVDTLTSGFLSNSECAETYQLNLVTFLQGICDSSYSGIECLLCINLSQTSTSCNLINQFCLVHNLIV